MAPSLTRSIFTRPTDLQEFPVSLKVGRQELAYGDERLVGAFAWNNIGRVFDAAKLCWQNSWFGVDFFTSRVVIPEDNQFNVNNDYEWFSGMYLTTTNVPMHLADIYFFSWNASQEAIAARTSQWRWRDTASGWWIPTTISTMSVASPAGGCLHARGQWLRHQSRLRQLRGHGA
jgi:hypothetical protein